MARGKETDCAPAFHALIRVFPLALLLLAAGCEDPSTSPSPNGVATIRVIDEVFRIALTTPELVEAAKAAQAGTGPRIPSGRIVPGAGVNIGWTWHLEDVEFVEMTIELCDGRPSMVEQQGTAFGGGRFCPWAAEVIEVR